MRRRIENYMKYVETMLEKEMTDEERETFLEHFLVQLQFYQHERLIHLLVTLTFALIGIISLLLNYFIISIVVAVFSTGTLIFLLFYIRHYFFLERSVQKMYTYYDRLNEPKIFTDHIINP
ncbi:MAG: hypothetical protein K6G64_10870 [Eubacterium sp.]|nr:hypothetical protein [Eubacterium sp.]